MSEYDVAIPVDPDGPITSFRGTPLSNFESSPLRWRGVRFRDVETPYQIAKTDDPWAAMRILQTTTPGRAKREGRKVPLRPTWEDEKVDVMQELLRLKFAADNQATDCGPVEVTNRQFLIDTGGRELIEGNHWHDQFWGSCTCANHIDKPGENWLGRLLMETRAAIARGEL